MSSCVECGARLSQYRTWKESICAPCDLYRSNRSFTFAESGLPIESRADEAFRVRWRGFEWDTVARLARFPSAGAANSAARNFAKRRGMVLP